jgi:hypothetical protein
MAAPARPVAPPPAALLRLPAEDVQLVTEFVLRSGSLKGLAAAYGVSYPTIRQRLDRLQERLRALLEDRPADPLRDLLADLVEQGELTAGAARRVREEVERERREAAGEEAQ